MTISLELSPEQEARLSVEAASSGLNLTDYALSRLLGGAELVAALRASGVIGTFADRPDSPEWARQLRETAERRA
jgi:hypothetical protein